MGKEINSSIMRKKSTSEVRAMERRRSLDIEVVHRISSSLGSNAMIPVNASVTTGDYNEKSLRLVVLENLIHKRLNFDE